MTRPSSADGRRDKNVNRHVCQNHPGGSTVQSFPALPSLGFSEPMALLVAQGNASSLASHRLRLLARPGPATRAVALSSFPPEHPRSAQRLQSVGCGRTAVTHRPALASRAGGLWGDALAGESFQPRIQVRGVVLSLLFPPSNLPLFLFPSLSYPRDLRDATRLFSALRPSRCLFFFSTCPFSRDAAASRGQCLRALPARGRPQALPQSRAALGGRSPR